MKAREGRIMAIEASDQGSRGVGRVGNFEHVYEWTRKLLRPRWRSTSFTPPKKSVMR